MDEVEFISINNNEQRQQDLVEPEIPHECIQNESQSSSEASASRRMKTFKNPKKQTYQKFVDSFTKEWKKTQDDLMDVLKAQDDKYFQNMQQQTIKEEEILKKHREETERMLEKDRLETSNMLSSFLNFLQPQATFSHMPFTFQSHQQTGHFRSMIMSPASTSSSIGGQLLIPSQNVCPAESSYSSFASSVSTDDNENVDANESLK